VGGEGEREQHDLGEAKHFGAPATWRGCLKAVVDLLVVRVAI